MIDEESTSMKHQKKHWNDYVVVFENGIVTIIYGQENPYDAIRVAGSVLGYGPVKKIAKPGQPLRAVRVKYVTQIEGIDF